MKKERSRLTQGFSFTMSMDTRKMWGSWRFRGDYNLVLDIFSLR